MTPRIDYRHVLAKLAVEPIYEDDTAYWQMLKNSLETVREYYAKIGLEVLVDQNAGYAYIRRQEEDSDDDSGERLDPIPPVLRKRMLSYPQTIFLVLLRERLLRHEQSPDAEAKLCLDENEIVDMLRPYLPEQNNDKTIRQKVKALINGFDKLNLIFPIKNRSEPVYRVEQIIKAKMPPETIAELREKLAGKSATTEGTGDDSGAESDDTPEPASSNDTRDLATADL